jgi:predicted permease
VALISSLLTIVVGLGVGLVAGRLLKPRLPDRAFTGLQRGLQGAALLVINPVAFLGALWALPTVNLGLAALPLVGLGTLAAAFGLGALVARWARLDPEKALLFRTDASYTNIGNLGSLSVFLLLGEAGFGLVPLYKLFEELWIYGVLFPHTRAGAARLKDPTAPRPAGGPWSRLKPVVTDPFVVVALVAVTLGLGLHQSGLVRPGWYGGLNAVLVPASSVLLLVSIGMTLKLSFSAVDLKPAFGVAALKVLVLPVVSLALTGLFGFWGVPAVWKTALVLAVMPMAFLSLIPPSLYGLDEKFPATAWAVSMVSLVVTLPVLGWITGL